MSEIDIILKEKNNKIKELEEKITNQKNSYEQKIENKEKEVKNSIGKERAAKEIYSRLIRIRPIGWIATIAPPVAALLGGVNFMAGGVIGIFSAAAAVMLMKKEIISEINRLKTKYRL